MSLTLETVLSKHDENDLLNQLIQKEKLIFIGAHEIHVLERSRDDDKTGVHRLIILFENLIVFSAPTGKDTFAHRAHLPLKKDAMTVFRISLGQLGLTLENRKFILTHRDFKRVGIVQNDSTIEKDLLNCLSHFRTIIGIEKESLLKELDHGFGYLQNLENVEYQERYFVNSRNEILFTPIYKQKSNARGLVFVVPGFGDTSPTLWSDFCLRRPIIESLLKKGFHVASIDHAGHGRSEGLPMFVSDFEQHLVGDVQAVINEAKKTLQTDKLPVFVYGESMGGNISLRLLLNGQASKSFAGGVLVAPMTQIGEDVKPPAWQVPLLRLASKVFPAAAIIPNKVETEGFKNPNDCVRCKQSPLSSPVDSIRLATADACMSACETLAPRFKELTTPFILIHGKSDTVIPLPFSQMLFDTAGSKEKVFKQYDDVYHCINAEEPKLLQPILNDIVEWLDARVKSIENEDDVNDN